MRVWLKNARIKKNYSQKRVADEAGIAQPYYHQIEHGEKNPSVPIAKRIADVLGFEWTLFFEQDGKRE